MSSGDSMKQDNKKQETKDMGF